MKDTQLRQVDLNLLVVIDVLLREQSITRTAEQLNLTQSAVSHALKRLRMMFGDELLVRDGRRMRPTIRAERLAETLPRILQQLTYALAGPEPFQPATSTRTFRLAAPDFIGPLVPLLLQNIGEMAPGVRVEFAQYSSMAAQELADGRYDALIAHSALKNEGLRGQPLGSWAWAVFGRADHPAFADWSLESWSSYPHLQIRATALRGQGPIERMTSKLGMNRIVGAVVPHFSMAAPILAQTNLLLTVPSMVMNQIATIYNLKRQTVPFELPQARLSLFRSAIGGDEPGIQWFLERVEAASRLLDESP